MLACVPSLARDNLDGLPFLEPSPFQLTTSLLKFKMTDSPSHSSSRNNPAASLTVSGTNK